MNRLLYSKFKESLRLSLRWVVLLTLIATAFFVFSLLTYLDVITVFEQTEKDASIQFVLALIFEMGAISGAFVVLVPYFRDYKLIKNETYIILNAVVSRFDFYLNGYEPIEKVWFPVFEDVNSGKTLKIKVDEKVEIGEGYSIAYLPRTKISVIKKSK